MATSTDTVTTTVSRNQLTVESPPQTLSLQLHSPKPAKKIQWQEGVVDNEGQGKRSSKCCCIYKKPRMFGESSSEDDSDPEQGKNCKAPKDYHKKAHKDKPNSHDHGECNACP